MKVLSWWRRCLGNKDCLLCHGAAVSDGLCAGCAQDLSALRTDAAAVCPRCGRSSTNGAVCGRCQQTPLPFERLWASVYYEAPASNMLYAFKHRAERSMLRPLCSMMLSHPPPWLESAGVDCVLAVPLSKQRRLFRGFNQSDGLAGAVGKSYGLPVLPHTAVFRRHHAPQSTLKQNERRKNVKNAFVLNNQYVKNRKILLVDDVATTGATFEELARTLKRAGASAVFCWALAHTQLKK
ncbi:ComF family protein [Neisseria musculi]|uniref:ComF family protein n=1 Tax=Neisseria musculi TaxID=1815583 RepID=UPI001FE2FCE0|nr:ComF family protein [Neisseria musculi]